MYTGIPHLKTSQEESTPYKQSRYREGVWSEDKTLHARTSVGKVDFPSLSALKICQKRRQNFNRAPVFVLQKVPIHNFGV